MDKFIFYFIASIILISALISVSAKNPIHSVLFLIVSVIFLFFISSARSNIFGFYIFNCLCRGHLGFVPFRCYDVKYKVC